MVLEEDTCTTFTGTNYFGVRVGYFVYSYDVASSH